MLLEKLRETRASLTGERYTFMDWTACTCGHIYMTAHGRMAAGSALVRSSKQPMYVQMLQVFIEANFAAVPAQHQNEVRRLLESPDLNPASLSGWASQITHIMTPRSGGPELSDGMLREAAIKGIDNAIEMVERQEREAMLDVAALAETASTHEFALGGD